MSSPEHQEDHKEEHKHEPREEVQEDMDVAMDNTPSPEEVAADAEATLSHPDVQLDEALAPFLERRDRSLKELLSTMDDCSPIIPDAVTDYYLSKAGFQTNDHRIKRLLALATQKFVSDIAADAYQFSRIRSQSGANPSRRSGSNKAVLTMEDLSNVLTEYGINTKRPDFYR